MQSDREVAAGVANLGNTCYMNAVLQALAHAPELCMAVECEPHCIQCPIYIAKQHAMSEGQEQVYSKDNFCLLCEVEQHLVAVHKSGVGNGTSTNEAVAPSDFVNGFISHVAPWFRLGVQEDSHEFLRLLIDAMQKSCVKSRAIEEKDHDLQMEEESAEGAMSIRVRVKKESEEDNDKAAEAEKSPIPSSPSKEGNEYSFRLFCGKVESIVKCSNCDATSSTIDPIEDIGLEVTPPNKGSTSPTSSSLTDVTSALEKFIATEHLDSGYKCESCSKVGRATKQSKLASIPPILTLHLKRFRYGNEKLVLQAPAASRRRTTELASLGGGDTGTSGSAKIEGHVKFEQVFDIRPYLTKEKQAEVKSMLCRLFAVIVHAGKNSHSGHYVAYVRNVAKNEWWKMDDARVTSVSKEEVVAAEAYMLFYRVVDHPVSVELKNKEKAFKEAAKKVIKMEEDEQAQAKEQQAGDVKEEKPSAAITESNGKGTKRKREAPEFKSGEEWARKMMSKPKSMLHAIRTVQEYFSERIEFKPEYFRSIQDEVEAGGRVGAGPSIGVSMDDIQNVAAVDGFKHALWTVFKAILPSEQSEFDAMLKPKENGSNALKKSDGANDATAMKDVLEDESKSNLIKVEHNETLI